MVNEEDMAEAIETIAYIHYVDERPYVTSNMVVDESNFENPYRVGQVFRAIRNKGIIEKVGNPDTRPVKYRLCSMEDFKPFRQ
jgi:hypothetical protein